MTGLFEKGTNDIQCKDCGQPMNGIMNASIRDTCSECGGKSKVALTHHKRSRASWDALIKKYPYNKAKK